MWQAAENDFCFIDAHSRSEEDVREAVSYHVLQQQLSAQEAEIKPRK